MNLNKFWEYKLYSVKLWVNLTQTYESEYLIDYGQMHRINKYQHSWLALKSLQLILYNNRSPCVTCDPLI